MRKDYLVAYDVTNDKRRRRIVKLLLTYGERVQYSVFEISLKDTEFPAFKKELKSKIKKEKDSIRIYSINEFVRETMILLGVNKVYDVEEDLIL